MTERTIYFDESGFTGYNLLDPAQPIFTIASADVAEERARDILRASFPRYQGAEYKFSNVWASRSRVDLLTFAAHLKEFDELSFVYVVDKRFAVLTKAVDFLIEPYMTDAGYDFYDDGFCWKYSNYIYYALTEFAPSELLDALVTHYLTFSRNPSQDTLAVLRSQLHRMANSLEEPPRIFLEQMAMGADLFERYNDLESFRSSNDLQATVMVASVSHWRQRYTEDFVVIHDASSNFLRSRKMWRAVTDPRPAEQTLKAGDGSFTPFPLRVVSTTPMDSRGSYSIQFCDVLAGLASRLSDPRKTDAEREFMNQVIDAGLRHVTSNGIRPSTEFPDQIPPKRLTGPDVIDQFSAMVSRSRAGRS